MTTTEHESTKKHEFLGEIDDLRIGAVVYICARDGVSAIYLEGDRREHHRAGAIRELAPAIDALRGELRNTVAVATGLVPELARFARDWGRTLLPDDVLASPPDVLVIVPHAMVHDIPFHLVHTDAGPLLGTRSGVSYTSSISLLRRCILRNPIRIEARKPRTVLCGATDVLADDRRFADIAGTVCAAFGAPGDPDEMLFNVVQPNCTRTTVKAIFRRKPPPDVLCIVAHGYLDNRDHRLSGLFVDRDNMGISERQILIDGDYLGFRDLPLCPTPLRPEPKRAAEILTAAEFEIDGYISSHLVALLGCSAGSGRVLEGDEPASLAEAFLHIGASSVLAPMWDCHVQAAGDWAREFFTSWLDQGVPKALAARNALTALHDAGVYPAHSGPLTLRGDWL
jgi:hypothetical protein